MVDHLSNGLLTVFKNRPAKGEATFYLHLHDVATGVRVKIVGKMRSNRARIWKTKYSVQVSNLKKHQSVTLFIEDESIHIKCLDRRISRFIRLRTLTDPSVMFDWLKLHLHPSFDLPQDVIPSGNMTGNIYQKAPFRYEDLTFPTAVKIEGPAFMRNITMQSIQQSYIT